MTWSTPERDGQWEYWHLSVGKSIVAQDGELLKCIGGPLNGQLRRISFPMPSILCPNAGFQLAASDRYERDDEKRAWVWKGKPCTSK